MKECEKEEEGRKKRVEETGRDEVREKLACREGAGIWHTLGISLHAPRNSDEISLEDEDVGWPQCAVRWSRIYIMLVKSNHRS